jgi:chromosomal replication initiation ATPase DnaA
MNAISPWIYLGIPNLIRPYALKYYIPDVSTIDGIVKCTAQAFEVEPEQIYSKNRRSKVSLARHAAIKIIRDRLKVTFAEISKHLGDRHHATILHSYKQANDLEAAYPPFKAKYAKALKLVEENITIIYRDTTYRDLGDVIQD